MGVEWRVDEGTLKCLVSPLLAYAASVLHSSFFFFFFRDLSAGKLELKWYQLANIVLPGDK